MLPRLLSAERGELDDAGRPVRAAVLSHFPDQVTELFDRSSRDSHRAAALDTRREATADHQPETTANAPG